MNDEHDPLIEQLRHEARQLRPQFSIGLHQQLTKLIENDHAVSVESSGSMRRLAPWMAIAAAVLIVCTAYFSASVFLHREVRSTRTTAKVDRVMPAATQAQTSSKPVVLQTLASRQVASVPVPIVPVPHAPGVVQKTPKEPPVEVSLPRQQFAVQAPVARPPALKSPRVQPPVVRVVRQQPVEVVSALKTGAATSTSNEPGPVATVLNNLNQVAPVKFMHRPENPNVIDDRATVDRDSADDLGGAVTSVVDAASQQIGNLFSGLQSRSGDR